MSALVVAIIVSVAAIVGYSSYLVFGPENKVEQACEEVIKVETGETVDLSPNELKQTPVQPETPGANGPSQPV